LDGTRLIAGDGWEGRVPSLVEKRSGAFFRLVKCTTNAPPCRAATGGTRHGQGYQGKSAGAGALVRLAQRTDPPARPRFDRDGRPRGAAGRARDESLRAP